MSRVIIVEEKSDKKYNGDYAIYDLIQYATDPNRTMIDSRRAFTGYENMWDGCVGYGPLIFGELNSENIDCAYALMMANNKVHGNIQEDIVRQRIISFDSSEIKLPFELAKLARAVVEFYNSWGHVCVYGIHKNTYNYHIHFVVGTANYKSYNNRFHISFEKNKLYAIVAGWENSFNISPEEYVKRCDILFGDKCLKQYETGLAAKEQISANYRKCSR